MHQLPKYDPPQFQPEMSGDLNNRVKSFFMFWGNLQQYLYNYLNNLRFVLQGGATVPYTTLTAAATIAPTLDVQPITGSTTITTIQVASDVTEFTLLAESTINVATGGNIASAATINTGQFVTFIKNLATGLWHVK